MSVPALILAALLKILFVIIVVMGAFAPLLVWAERRQSSMIQDRVGPSRAGIPLSDAIRQMMRATVQPLRTGASLSLIGAIAAGIGYVVVGLSSGENGEPFLLAIPALLLLGGVMNFGSKMHAGWAKQGSVTLLGTLHSAADALKMVWKEDFTPPKADKFLFGLAPIITVIPAVVAFAVIPFADTLYLDYWDQVLPATGAIGGPAVGMQIAPLNLGILFIFAVAGTGVIGAAIGGYASDNKYSLMGGIRAASQMVSYEVALGLTLVPCFMLYGTLELGEMATYQDQVWGVVHPPLMLAFVLYFISAIAETKRVPFDAPEGESELVGGYLTEYSGMKFGMFFTGEFVEVVALSCIATVIFFGGWDLPFLERTGFVFWESGTTFGIPFTDWVVDGQIPLLHWGVLAIQVVVFLLKVIGFVFLQLMIRWSLPRFRYDQIMKLCWKGILPLSILNILFTAVYILLFLE